MTTWPKKIIEWFDGDIGYMSIPFTWLLPSAKHRIQQHDMFVSRWIVGGPAVYLMPDYPIGDCEVKREMPGVLQRVNPQATRTTLGCIRKCKFCGVNRIEGGFSELSDWPDLPILCDNNLLASSKKHFDRVINRLIKHGSVDFNQGIDARLLTQYHANRISEIKNPIVRVAIDHDNERDIWATAIEHLRTAGIAKKKIRSYVLCGFADGPNEDRDRCEYVESFGIPASPMWFHELDTLKLNSVTEKQKSLGWTDKKRKELMGWYYKHRTCTQ